MDEQKDHFLLALETTRASGIVIDKKNKKTRELGLGSGEHHDSLCWVSRAGKEDHWLIY